MLYRFYKNGIRYTVQAETKKEALAKFKRVKREYKAEFAKGNPARCVSRQRKPHEVGTFQIGALNAYDLGYLLGACGFSHLEKFANRLTGKLQHTMARQGLVDGARRDN